MSAALAQTGACLPLVQWVPDSIPGMVENFNMKIFNLGSRSGGDGQLLLSQYFMLRRQFVILISIRPLNGNVKHCGTLGAYRKE